MLRRQLVDKVVLCLDSFGAAVLHDQEKTDTSQETAQYRVFLDTIPLSKLRFDISLYTRETGVCAEF